MDFNVGDVVEVISSVSGELIGEIADVVSTDESGEIVFVRFINARLHTYHTSLVRGCKVRAFSADKLFPIEREAAQVSEEDLMRVLGVIT